MCGADVEGVCKRCRKHLCGSCLILDHPCRPRRAKRRRIANKQLAALIEELEYCEMLRREVKRQSMIFHRLLKEQVAAANSLPYDAYYDLSYDDWYEVWREWKEKQAA